MGIRKGLKAYYKLNESSGSTAEDFFNDNDGTYKGNLPTQVSGIVNDAQDFDGSGDKINMGDVSSFNFPEEFTFSLWFKTSDDGHLLSKDNNSVDGYFARLNNGNIEFGNGGVAVLANTNNKYDDGKWHHLILKRDSSDTITLNIDNGSEKITNSVSTDFSNNVDFVLGDDNGGDADTANDFDGQMDEVGIWDRALSSSEVSDLYNSGNGKTLEDMGSKEDDLKAVYKLDESSGSTATDSHGSNNGTYKGNLPTAVSGKDGNAQDFNGSGDYVNLGGTSDFDFSGSFTISGWFNSSSGGWDDLWEKGSNGGGGEYRLVAVTGDSQTVAFLSDWGGGSHTAIVESSNTYNDGNWHHVIVTRDNNDNMALYVDGTQVDTGSSSIDFTSNTDALIGDGFDGQIDEVYIWERAIGKDEIDELYSSGSGEFYPFEITQTLTETTTISDSLSTDKNKIAQLSDSVTITDGDFREIKKTQTETITSSDTQTQNHTILRVFQDGANSLNNGNIHVSEATYKKQRNAPKEVKLKTGGNLFVSLGENAVYKDIKGNTILEGTIRKIKELNKGGNESIYEVQIFDEAHILSREVLNEIYRNKTPEDILKDIVEKYGFTFQNNLPFTSNQNIDKKVYIDFKPIEAVNELAETLNALWETDNKKFILYQEGAEKSSIDLNEDGNWTNPEGFVDDTDKQANSVIVRGQEILQRTSESFTGTKKVFTLSREPVDVEVSGLTQSTENINGDYSVDTQNKKVTFNNSQTDPTINYSYWSKIRVRSGQTEPVAQIERKYIETVFEARELARNYLDKYQDGITSAEFENSDLFDVNINNLRPGDRIDVKAKDQKRSGEYIINEIKRKYPKKTVVQIGEDLSSLWNWQKEARSRINQLETRDRNEDFVQLDEFNKGNLSIDFSAQLTDLYYVENTGEILWASNTQFSNDADKIDNNSADSEVALAYNDDSLPSNSVTDIIGNSQSLQ